MRLRVSTLAVLVLTGACDGPTSPTCDAFGRGPVPFLVLTCAPAGSDVQCQATREELSYCRGPARDVTADAIWISSSPHVGVFNTPGYMTAVGAGLVEIRATFGFLAADAIAFTLAPNSPAERMLELSVIISDTDARRLADVTVHILPERGVAQACTTNQFGHCEFWVFDSPVQVIATKPGFHPVEAAGIKRSPELITARLTMTRQE